MSKFKKKFPLIIVIATLSSVFNSIQAQDIDNLQTLASVDFKDFKTKIPNTTRSQT